MKTSFDALMHNQFLYFSALNTYLENNKSIVIQWIDKLQLLFDVIHHIYIRFEYLLKPTIIEIDNESAEQKQQLKQNNWKWNDQQILTIFLYKNKIMWVLGDLIEIYHVNYIWFQQFDQLQCDLYQFYADFSKKHLNRLELFKKLRIGKEAKELMNMRVLIQEISRQNQKEREQNMNDLIESVKKKYQSESMKKE